MFTNTDIYSAVYYKPEWFQKLFQQIHTHTFKLFSLLAPQLLCCYVLILFGHTVEEWVLWLQPTRNQTMLELQYSYANFTLTLG